MSESQVDQLTADQLRALGQVKEGKAALELAKINLSYTSIASPIDGRIGRATVTPGNLVGRTAASWPQSFATTRSASCSPSARRKSSRRVALARRVPP